MARSALPDDAEQLRKLGERIRVVADNIDSRSMAAEVAGITTQQLRNLIAGKSAPSLLVIGRLCDETGYSLDWVCTGEGAPRRADSSATPSTPPLDPNLFGRILDAIAKAYKEAGVDISHVELGRLAAIDYQAFSPLASTEDEQINVAAMVKTKHARTLANESFTHRKHEA